VWLLAEPPAPPPAPLVIDLNDLLAAAERVIALIPEPVLATAWSRGRSTWRVRPSA